MLDFCETLRADSVVYENDMTPLLTRDPLMPIEPPERGWLCRGRLYVRDDTPIAFLCQPYSLTTEDLKGILEFCERYRLECDVSTNSEWEPGKTLGLLFWRRELNPFITFHLLPTPE